MKKIFSIIFITLGATIITLSLHQSEWSEDLSSHLNSEQMLIEAINKDLVELKKNGELPEQWNSIKYITINNEFFESMNLKKELAVVTTIDGQYSLNCTVLNENPTSRDGRYLIKFTINENKSNNQIWEKFRLYNSKKKPLK